MTRSMKLNMKYQTLVDLDSKDKQCSKTLTRLESINLSSLIRFLYRARYRIMLFCLLTFSALFITGFYTKCFEKSFTNFIHPVHHANFRYLIQAIKSNCKLPVSDFHPLYNRSEYSFYYNPAYKCQRLVQFNKSEINPLPFNELSQNEFPHPVLEIPEVVQLLIVVKSAVCNFHFRNAIRQTWGNEQRFVDFNIRTVFMLGECNLDEPICVDPGFDGFGTIQYPNWLKNLKKDYYYYDCKDLIKHESHEYRDIVQANFQDTYYNNTLKTIACFQWVTESCSEMPFIFFIDDDYYLSIKNLLNFMKNFLDFTAISNSTDSYGNDRQRKVDYDGRLYAGFVYPNSRPQRGLFSKWSIGLDEYPFSHYPPYVTGGAFLMNNRTISDIYYASLFTKRFAFDDVYLGILAWKMQIKLIHNSRMFFHRKEPDSDPQLVASHGFKEPGEMAKVWFQQKRKGFA